MAASISGSTATPGSAAPPSAQSERPEPSEFDVHLRALLAFFVIGFCLWLGFAWSGYAAKYTQTLDGWRLGTTQLIELTLVKEDRQNLACASDVALGDLHCGYQSDGRSHASSLPETEEDRHELRPYNTVKNELFLAAGLWSSSALRGALPGHRFTVVCNYSLIGLMKSVSLRWSPTGTFDPARITIPAGVLSDCVIPQ